MAIERIEIHISVEREHGLDGIDPSALRKIELLLALDGVQDKLQVGCRREFVLGQLSGDLEEILVVISERSRSTFTTLTSTCR